MATITGSSGNDSRNDTVNSADLYNMGDGNDTVLAGPGNDTINGDAGNDSLYGQVGADQIFGGTGNDTMDGGTGADIISGGDNDDYIFESDFANGGNDSINGGAGIDTVDFSAGGSGISAVLVNGNATVNPTGPGNNDTLVGIENLVGTAFADTLGGDVNANALYGGGGADSISGGDGNDTLAGGSGSDQLYGGAGNDTFIEGNDAASGADSIFGGAGSDTVDYSASTAAINANLSGATDTVNPTGNSDTDTLVGVENIIGSNQNDTITGDIQNNFFSGLDGADNLSGLSGDDTLRGGAGADTLSGGVGSDWADYTTSSAGVNVNLNDTLAESGGHAQGDVLTGIENLAGSGFNDTLTGSNEGNAISGGAGDDTINGNYGSDSIDGGTGNDFITAGPTTAPVSSPPADLFLDWESLGDGTNLAGGFTQNTGGINVQVTYTGGVAGSTIVSEDDASIYVAGGEPFDSTSSVILDRPGAGEITELTMDFSAVGGSGYSDAVSNVQFRISDIDTGGFTDQVTIRAYDAYGNEIPVTITEVGANGELDVNGNTVTATGNGTSPNSSDGSVLIQVAGPVAQIVIQYTDLDDAYQLIHVSDVHFTTIPAAEGDQDTVAGGDGDDTILGGIGNDSLSGDAGNDSLLGQDGDDRLLGGDGNDRISGGSGNDTIDGGANNDSIDGGTGNDSILFGAGDDTVLGGDGDDFIDDNVGGFETGNNLLDGGTGNDTIWAGDGSDTVLGDAGNDVLNGEAGADIISGGAGNDTISGGDGADSLNGGADRDSISGGADNDTIIGGAGTDTLSGGTGNDTFVLNLGDTFTDTVTAELIDGGGTPGTSPGDFDTIDLTAYGWDQVVIVPGAPEAGTIYIYSDATQTTLLGVINYTEIEEIIPCFTLGTMILTDRGEVAVEALAVGDLVMTRDNGLQPLRWIGQRKLSALELQADPDLQPVRIAKGTLSGAGPDRTMLVSPQHRVLIEGARAELLFGEAEVLVPAKHLIGHADVTRALPAEGVTYLHILFDRHEIVQSDGIWTESFQPAERMLSAMDADVRAEVLALFPQLEQSGEAFEGARLSLKAHEARVLFAAE
jgi:Ca2+-binding RTX toxin-like protein